MQLWRLAQRARREDAFSGRGASLYAGRWNPRGVRVVYCSATLALCLLEVLVHADVDDMPDVLFAFPIRVPPSLRIRAVQADALPRRWRAYPAPKRLQEVGARWVASGRSAILRVPSAIVPQEHNYLLNPVHPDFRKLSIGSAQRVSVDQRLT